MKRNQALTQLSRDHHQALVVAARLKRATSTTADDAREHFLNFWAEQGQAHFQIEERVLLPAWAAYGDPYHPLVARVLGDHVAIRRDALELARGTVGFLLLRDLGVRLAEHVRLEERELFPLIEDALPPEALLALQDALIDAGKGMTDG